ncbi:hypothetical protein [Halovivax sp.]|uniref:hypothetical protein n=1 Tax=Halovivax sp. TaxID=1935978 RepID=UPI0025B7FFF9|nr:hypothetical protein [Halovivax sp.]
MSRAPAVWYAAVGLAAVSAIVHLLLGLDGVFDVLAGGTFELRPALFVLAAALVTGLVYAIVRTDLPRRPLYAAGAILMAAHVVAYADWHAFGVTESVLGLEDAGHGHEHESHGHDNHGHDDDHDHGHEGSALEILFEHLRDDPIALATKSAETVAAGAFAWLTYRNGKR